MSIEWAAMQEAYRKHIENLRYQIKKINEEILILEAIDKFRKHAHINSIDLDNAIANQIEDRKAEINAIEQEIAMYIRDVKEVTKDDSSGTL